MQRLLTSRILKYLVKICYASETQETIRLLVRDLNVVHGQFRRPTDNCSFGQNVPVGSRTDMTSVDFYSDWHETGQINIPTGVKARGGFCENHADAAMQHACRLSCTIGHRHPQYNVFGID